MIDRLDRLVSDHWDHGRDEEIDEVEWKVWEDTAGDYASNHPIRRETTELTPFIMHHVSLSPSPP